MKSILVGFGAVVAGAWAVWSLVVGGMQLYTGTQLELPIVWLHPFWFWFSLTPLIAAGVAFLLLVFYLIGDSIRGIK